MSGIIVLILRILAAISLYAFTGWAIFTLWRELRQQTLALTTSQIPSIHLRTTGDGENTERAFQSSEIIVGRDEKCDYPVSDDTVSSRHVRLSYHHKHWWVEDLQSTNGTFLNDERIYTSTVIVSGDELRCGKINMEINIDSD